MIGFPRLVRLNPNIPWKTRGNGAICLKIGKGYDDKFKIGKYKDIDLFSYKRSKNNLLDKKIVIDIVIDALKKYSKIDEKNTNPGFVILNKKPEKKFYYNVVRKVISIDETIKFLDEAKCSYKGFKNKRGLIGATAAAAWNNKNDKTYEVISYRNEDKWGLKRFVDDASVKKMDNKTNNTFDSFDYTNNHNRITPSSPCPILYGIRGEDINELIDANLLIHSEKSIGWMIFETNQATDDHLVKTNIVKIKPYMSVIVQGEVVSIPNTIKGGHVFFKIKDDSGIIDCAAYEPTKEFRDIIRELIIGDVVEVYGGVREKPLTINLEKIFVKKIVKKIVKIENPVCLICGKHMKSKGRNQGFKCVKCKTQSDKSIFEEEKRKIESKFYEAPVCARRHLSKPLKRMKERP